MRIGRALVVTLAALSLGTTIGAPKLPIHDGVGGSFTARSSLGRDLSLSELRGRVVLLFFGYTSCQDVCPATLSHLKALVKRLGSRASGVQVLLVTVDPENDTAEHLAEYLAQFDPRFVGLTGTREETDRLAGLFLVKHDRSHGVELSTRYNRTKTPAKHAYLYSHSQQIYLLDKLGRTRALYFTGTPLEEMEAAVGFLLAERVAEGAEPSDASAPAPAQISPHGEPGHHTHDHTEGAKK